MANRLYNLARMSVSIGGTGVSITLGPVVAGWLSFADAGVINGATINYAINDPTGGGSEVGTGIYDATSTSITRTVITSTNANTRINVSTSAQVVIAPSATELNLLYGLPTTSTDKAIVRFSGASGAMQNTGVVIDDTDHINAINGTAALPAYAFANDPDSGLYRIGANNLGISVNGAKVIDISTSKVSVTGLYGQSSAAYASSTAGDYEYDGKAFANLPVASDRGIAPSVHFLSLAADQTGTNGNAAQTWFPGGGLTTYNAPASTAFFFDGVLYLARTAGTTSHTTSFLLGGTATFTSINGVAQGVSTTGNVNGAPFDIRIDAATATLIAGASTVATENIIMKVSGIMRINAAGTVIPQFIYSVAPGGAPTIKANSYFRLYPIGADTVLSVGNWS